MNSQLFMHNSELIRGCFLNLLTVSTGKIQSALNCDHTHTCAYACTHTHTHTPKHTLLLSYLPNYHLKLVKTSAYHTRHDRHRSKTTYVTNSSYINFCSIKTTKRLHIIGFVNEKRYIFTYHLLQSTVSTSVIPLT